jgi:hypothetical protein
MGDDLSDAAAQLCADHLLLPSPRGILTPDTQSQG